MIIALFLLTLVVCRRLGDVKLAVGGSDMYRMLSDVDDDLRYNQTFNASRYGGQVLTSPTAEGTQAPGIGFGQSVCTCNGLIFVSEPGDNQETKGLIHVYKYSEDASSVEYVMLFEEEELQADIESALNEQEFLRAKQYYGFGSTLVCSGNFLFASYPNASAVYSYYVTQQEMNGSTKVVFNKTKDHKPLITPSMDPNARYLGIGLAVQEAVEMPDYKNDPTKQFTSLNLIVSGSHLLSHFTAEEEAPHYIFEQPDSGYFAIYNVSYTRNTFRITSKYKHSPSNKDMKCGIPTNITDVRASSKLTIGGAEGAVGCRGSFYSLTYKLLSWHESNIVINPSAKLHSVNVTGILNNSSDIIISKSDHVVRYMNYYNHNYMRPDYVYNPDDEDTYYLYVSPIYSEAESYKQVNTIYIYKSGTLRLVLDEKISYSTFDTTLNNAVLKYGIQLGSGSILDDMNEAIDTNNPLIINNHLNPIRICVSKLDPANKNVGTFANLVQVSRGRNEELFIALSGSVSVATNSQNLIAIANTFEDNTQKNSIIVFFQQPVTISTSYPLHTINPVSYTEENQNTTPINVQLSVDGTLVTSSTSVTVNYNDLKLLLTLDKASFTYAGTLNTFVYNMPTVEQYLVDNTNYYDPRNILSIQYVILPTMVGPEEQISKYKINSNLTYRTHFNSTPTLVYDVIDVQSTQETSVVGEEVTISLQLLDSDGNVVSLEQYMCPDGVNTIFNYSFDFSDIINTPMSCEDVVYSEDFSIATIDIPVPTQLKYLPVTDGDTKYLEAQDTVNYTISAQGAMYSTGIIKLAPSQRVSTHFTPTKVLISDDGEAVSPVIFYFAPVDQYGNTVMDWDSYNPARCDVASLGISTVSVDGVEVILACVNTMFDENIAFSFEYSLDIRTALAHTVNVTYTDGATDVITVSVGYGPSYSAVVENNGVNLFSQNGTLICEERETYLLSGTAQLVACLKNNECGEPMAYSENCAYKINAQDFDKVVSFSNIDGVRSPSIHELMKPKEQPKLHSVSYSLHKHPTNTEDYIIRPNQSGVYFYFLDEEDNVFSCAGHAVVNIEFSPKSENVDYRVDITETENSFWINDLTGVHSFDVYATCYGTTLKQNIAVYGGPVTRINFKDEELGFSESYKSKTIEVELYSDSQMICDGRTVRALTDRDEEYIGSLHEKEDGTCSYEFAVNVGKKGYMSIRLLDDSGTIGYTMIDIRYNGLSIFGWVILGLVCAGIVAVSITLVLLRYRLGCCEKGEHLTEMLESSNNEHYSVVK